MKIFEIKSSEEYQPYAVEMQIALIDFVERSQSDDATNLDYHCMINSRLGQRNFGLFIAIDDLENNKFSGFAILTVEKNFAMTRCLRRAVYIKPCRPKNIWKMGDLVLKMWAKEHGCTKDIIFAKRCPKAYFKKKLQPLGYMPSMVMFEREL